MKRMLPLALLVLLCTGGAVTATIALAADPPAGRPEVHQVFAPGIAGDTNVLEFPTVPPEGFGECIEILWDYRATTAGPFGGGFPELGQLHKGGVNAWFSGSYINEPLLNLDVAVPNVDAENVVVTVEFEDGSALGMRMWLGPDGHWRQSIRVDNDEFHRHHTLRISICPKPRTAAPATNAKVETLDPNTVKIEPPAGAGLAGTKLLLQASPGDAIFGATSLVFRPNDGSLIVGPTVSSFPGDFNSIPLLAVDTLLQTVPLTSPQATLVDTFKYDNNRTGFIVEVTEPQTTWKPNVSLKFPNNFNPSFLAPTILYAGEPRFFSLILPDNLTGTFTLPQVVPAITGGSGYASAPDGAKLVYGQPQVEWTIDALEWFVRVPVCNPLAHAVTLTNAGVDAWRLGADGNPDLLITGTMTDTFEPGECRWKELLRQAARTRNGTIPPAPPAIPPDDGWADYYSAGGPSVP